MKIGKSVQKAIDEWLSGDMESAMLHARNAVDGTSRKQAYSASGNANRFKRFLRENYDLLGPIGLPGVDLVNSKFPIKLDPKESAQFLDMADIIYRVHRCAHGHGDDLPLGFELIADAAGPADRTRMQWSADATLRLSDRIIFAMLATVVSAKQNVRELIPASHYLTIGTHPPSHIHEWWGRKDEMLQISNCYPTPLITYDFSIWQKARSAI